VRGRTTKRWRFYATLAALLGALIFPQAPRAVGSGAIRIMPLGDSITEGKSGDATYRYFLWHLLLDAGHSVDFVGSMVGVKGGLPLNSDFDQDHEGHSGWTADKMGLYARDFAQQANADIVLVHLGTNDILRGHTNASTRKDLKKVINQLRLANPQVVILLAEIIPIAGKETQVQNLNSRIRTLAAEVSSTTSPVIAVDQHTGFSVSSDLYDGVHPSQSGYAKMADQWFATLGSLLGDGSSPTTVTLTAPSPGALFASGSIIPLVASVNGTDPVLKVVFLANDIPIGEDATSPYEFDLIGPGDGQVALRADAHEQSGVIIPSQTVVVTVGSPPASPTALLVVGNPASVTAGDSRVIDRMTSLGFEVVVKDDDGITALAASGKTLVLISASVTSGKIGATFAATAVPVVTWEGGLFDDLGLTGPTLGVDYGETAGTDQRKRVVMTVSTHPLAAGLSGTVTVSDPASRFMWGLPASSAALVATLENDPTKYAVFGYESGATMFSGSAPARRVGLFLHEATAATLTAAGWSIFDASVQWATGG
jgi:acyl-CoA thioesterase I